MLNKHHIRYFHNLYSLEALELEKKRPLKILDVGCGRGELTLEIFKRFKKAKLTACDNDKKDTF